MREPSFWWRDAGAEARLLAPLGAIYGAVAARRLAWPGRRVVTPVICVGNLTMGGAGKTPAAIAIAALLAGAGEQPVFLTRGYGGASAGPLRVDPSLHDATRVGDEPLLLARTAITIVARDRPAGARVAMSAGASVIVMDDGFQNPSLEKDCSILIVDGRRGVGNGYVIPAGPLRAPIEAQLARADAIVVVGEQVRSAPLVSLARARGIAVFQARLEPDARFIAALGRGRVLGFAGIGDPDKFFVTLRDAGIAVAAFRSFPDHHRYSRGDAQSLCQHADRDGLILVTTEKDAVRLQGDDEAAALAAQAHSLPVTLVFEDKDVLLALLRQRLAARRPATGAISV